MLPLYLAYYVIPVVLLVGVVYGLLRGSRQEDQLEKMLQGGRTFGGMKKRQSIKPCTRIRKESVK